MNDLDWMIGKRFREVIRYEYTWTLAFEGGVGVTVECLWRLLGDGRIQRTSNDDGHEFGLPAPVDAAAEATKSLTGASVVAVALRDGTLDLEIMFDNGRALQLIPTSAAYEAWTVYDGPRWFVAVGGGRLEVC